MEFRILGPLEVHGELGAIRVSGRKPRAVLAVLLLHANEPVSPERLALALWGEEAPGGAVSTVQVHVSRLRKALGDGEVVTTSPAGYRIRVQPGELDAERFERLVEDGRRLLAAGDADRAATVLVEALALWRGPPLADLAFEPFAQAEIARLEEQRQAALEVRIEADLAAGRHAEVVGELRRLVADHPTSERLAGHLMIALYRCGRQAEALDAYRHARETLTADLGIEPGPELRALQDAVLRHDSSLDLALTRNDFPDELDVENAPPLVGRDAELAWLRAWWDEAQVRGGGLVTLVGEHGIGKSRLAGELAKEVHGRGAAVLYAPAGRADEVFAQARQAPRPLLVVVDDAGRAREEIASAARDLGRDALVVALTENAGEDDPSVVLVLDPLDESSVRAIVTQYAPPETADDIPAGRLLSESAGIPRRVHDLASQWARREAARRVQAVASRAAAGRADLRSLENELAGGVFQLQTAPEVVEPGDGDSPVVCPFKGLASFDADDAPYFFGRERLVAELVARLVGAPLLGVVGASGSGKSSVVRAGLLPALAGGVLPRSQTWPRACIRPGAHPLTELREAVKGLDWRSRYVLAVDQFEEVFTVCRDEDERARFIAALVEASRGDAGAVVIAAIRSDFYGHCAAYPEFARLLAANHVLVGGMVREELERAIEGPAQRVGLRVEPGLVKHLVDDVEDEPGALPVLSSALLELWQHRQGRWLVLAAYEHSGGVKGAVERLANEAYGRLDDAQQALARRILLRLVDVDEDGSVERRRVPLEEFGDSEDAGRVLGLLADRRLLSISDGAVELAHEALWREWPLLRGWIEDDLQGLRVHRSLRTSAREWREVGRDDGALYRGARLEEARAWAERDDASLTDAERNFLTASLDHDRRERAAHRRGVATAFAALAVGLVVIGIVAVIAINQRQDAERQRDIATSRQLALTAEKLVAVDPALSTRLALWALDTSRTREADAALREATSANHQLAVLRADSLDANTAAYSSDGSRIVTGGTDGIARVWDTGTRRELGRLDPDHDALLTVRYAPDGLRIALGFADGTVLVTDASLGGPRVVLRVKDVGVEHAAFSGDGERLALGLSDGTVRVLATDGAAPPRRLTGHEGPVLGVDIDRSGTRVISAGEDGTVRYWTSMESAGRVLHRGSESARDVEFSPDGRWIMAVGDDGWIRLWDARSGAVSRRVNGGGKQLLAAAFSSDGRRFAAGGHDGVTRVWSMGGGGPVAMLRGQRSRIYDVDFGAKSDRLVSAGDDGTARIWDVGQTQSWSPPGDVDGIAFNSDGRFLASASEDGAVRVWEAATGRLRATLPGPPGYTTAKFSPASNTLVVASHGGSRVRTWPVSADAGELIARLSGDRSVYAARFDGSGNRIVYVDTTGKVVVHELASGRESELGGAPETVYDAQFSPDGKQIAAVAESGGLLIWRIDRPAKPERVLKGHSGHINGMAYSRDGRIATAGSDRTVRVWDPADGQPVVLQGHEDEVTSVVFTADGARVLSTSFDGTLRLWDSRTGAALGVLQSGPELLDVVLTRDGLIATIDEDDVVRIFPCEVCGDLEVIRALARARAPTPLSAEERRRYSVED